MDYDDYVEELYVEELCDDYLDTVKYTQLRELYDFDFDWESIDIKEFLITL